MKKATLCKHMAMLLSMVMLVASVPLQGYALIREMLGEATETAAEVAEVATSAEDVFVVAEDTTKRGEFEKHYLCSDGTFVAVSYPEAVHFKDEQGRWQDVDQTLTLDERTQVYKTSASDFEVSLAKEASAEGIVRIAKNGYALTWGVAIDRAERVTPETRAKAAYSEVAPASVSAGDSAGELTASASVSVVRAQQAAATVEPTGATPAETPRERLVSDDRSFALPHVAAQVSYADVFGDAENISLRYTVYYNKVEEDILIYERGDIRSVSMTMDVGSLTPVVNADGSVDLVDAAGEMQFHVGIPYMVDAAYAVCNDIEVTAEKTGTLCVIQYTPDADWFDSAERVFPILLDPAVTTADYTANMQDTYVEENTTDNHSSEQYLYINTNGNNRRKAIIRFTQLPVIDESMPIVDAKLTLTSLSPPFYEVPLRVKYYDSWLDFEDYTYARLENISETDYQFSTTVMSLSTSRTVTVNITSHIYSMYEEEYMDEEVGWEYHGDFVIEYADPDYDIYTYPFGSSENTTAADRPVLTVKYGYSLPAGLENGQMYSFKSEGYMSAFSLNLTYDSNIYQALRDAPTDRERFILEKVAETGGYRLRSYYSAGTGRLVAIDTTNGVIESGDNVYTVPADTTDPVATEWLIIPVSSSYFRIVPRADMSMALTVCGSTSGTNGGRDPDSPGNIFVQERNSTGLNQMWKIYDDENNLLTPLNMQPPLGNGNHYLSNFLVGGYFHRSNMDTNCATGTISALGEATVKWKLVNLKNNYFVIQRSDMAGYYLAPVVNAQGSFVRLYYSVSETIPDNYMWSIQQDSTGYTIRHKTSGLYLSILDASADNPAVCLSSRDGTNGYAKTRWRIEHEDNYVELRTVNTIFHDIAIDVGEYSAPTVTGTADWATYRDFDYEIVSGGQHVSYNVATDIFTGLTAGSVSITATHRVTGREFEFAITIFPGTFEVKIYACRIVIDLPDMEETLNHRAGHGWIVIHNNTAYEQAIGHYVLPSGGDVTIGRWGSQIDEAIDGEYVGIWYNREAYEYAQGRYTMSIYSSCTADRNSINQISSLILSSYAGYDILDNNCIEFAVAAWNYCASSENILSVSLDIPNLLFNAIEELEIHSEYASHEPPPVNECGYYNGTTYITHAIE